MAASKLLQKHLFFRSCGLQPQAYHDTLPSFFFKKMKWKLKKLNWLHIGYLIVKAQQHQPKSTKSRTFWTNKVNCFKRQSVHCLSKKKKEKNPIFFTVSGSILCFCRGYSNLLPTLYTCRITHLLVLLFLLWTMSGSCHGEVVLLWLSRLSPMVRAPWRWVQICHPNIRWAGKVLISAPPLGCFSSLVEKENYWLLMLVGFLD